MSKKQRLYIIVILLLILTLLFLFKPWKFEETYTLHFSNLDENNCDDNICIKYWEGDAPNLDGRATIEFNEPIDLNTVNVNLNINSEGKYPIYVNDELFWNPLWEDYVLLKTFENDGEVVDLYVNPSMSDDFFNYAPTIEGWLEKNAVGKTVWMFSSNITNPVNENIKNEYKSRITIINSTLRGTNEFYVCLNDTLNLVLWKKDYDLYEGRDEFNISLTNLKNNLLVYNETFFDNGEEEQIKKIRINDLDGGIYKLRLENKLGLNRNEDGFIEKIKINTNRIILNKESVLLDPTTLFTKNLSPNLLYVIYSHRGKDQIIILNNDTNLNLSEKYFRENFPIILKGKSNLEFTEGDVRIIGEMYYSFDQNNYFEPYKYIKNNYKPDFLIYNKAHSQIKENKFTINSVDAKIQNIEIIFRTGLRRDFLIYLSLSIIAIITLIPYKKLYKKWEEFLK